MARQRRLGGLAISAPLSKHFAACHSPISVNGRLLIGFALGLQSFQFGHGFGTLAIKPSFLNLEVTELLFVSYVRLQDDPVVAMRFGKIVERVLELFVAVRIESEFQSLDAALTPEAIHDDLDQFAFNLTTRLEIVLETGKEASVFFDIVGRKQHGASGERGLDRVLGRSGKPGGGAGAGGQLGIGSVSGELGW